MKTIITVKFSNYSENEIINSTKDLLNLIETLKSDSDFVSIEIFSEGDDIEAVKKILSNRERLEKDVNVRYCDEDFKTFQVDMIVRADGKVKVLFDTFGGEWVRKFQKIQHSSNGAFLKIYGRRVYFASCNAAKF